MHWAARGICNTQARTFNRYPIYDVGVLNLSILLAFLRSLGRGDGLGFRGGGEGRAAYSFYVGAVSCSSRFRLGKRLRIYKAWLCVGVTAIRNALSVRAVLGSPRSSNLCTHGPQPQLKRRSRDKKSLQSWS